MRSASIALASISLALCFISGAALAGEECEGFDVVTHLFEVSDTDGDGFLGPEEFDEAGLVRYGIPFEAYDADGDGLASLDEYYDLYDRHHAAAEDPLES